MADENKKNEGAGPEEQEVVIDKKKKDEGADPEEAQVNAYMETPHSDEEPTDKERLYYLRQMYEQVKADYKALMLRKEQAERMKDDQELNQLTPLFRRNFKRRVDCVVELRKIGEIAKDPWVPSSKT